MSSSSLPVTRVSSLTNQLVSSSQSGVTIWNTQTRSVTRILTSESVDQVRYLNSNTIVTITRSGTLSYWNTDGTSRSSTSITQYGSHTSMLVRNSNEVIVGTKRGNIVYFNSQGIVTKVEETKVEIVNMTLLVNNNLVTVDTDNKLKIYSSSTNTLIKTIDRSTESSQIRYITAGFVDSTEYVKYTVNSKFVVFNYNTEVVYTTIETYETIQAIQYVNNRIVAVAVQQNVYYYELTSRYMIEKVSINRDILNLDSNTTHVFVGTKTGEISILTWINKRVTTFVKKQTTSETVIGTNTGRIAVLNSKNIITKTIETNVEIKSMTFLTNFNLVSVDKSKNIKIWKSSTYELVKTLTGSTDTGEITLISNAIISNQEFIVYVISKKLYVLNFNSNSLQKQIEFTENIVSFKYLEGRLSAVALTRTLIFYYLDDETIAGRSSLTSDIVKIIDGTSSFVRVETKTGIVTVNVVLIRKKNLLISNKALNETKLMPKLNPIIVKSGVVIPVPISKLALIEKDKIIYEKLIFNEPMIALKLLNDTTLATVSDDARMALVDIKTGIKIKEIDLDMKIDDLIDAIIQISDELVMIKIKKKVVQVDLNSQKVESISID